jgi:hypothetical protein
MVTVVSVPAWASVRARPCPSIRRVRGRRGGGAEGDGSLPAIGAARREKNERRAILELWSRKVSGPGRWSRDLPSVAATPALLASLSDMMMPKLVFDFY